jgi:hypothetical protein
MGEHRTDLTEVMKERLNVASSENREKGDLNDDNRLISSWKEANSKELRREPFSRNFPTRTTMSGRAALTVHSVPV